MSKTNVGFNYKEVLPNVLTVLRLLLIPLILFFLSLKPNEIASWNIYIFYSLLLFILASVTDFFDGYLARKWKVVSNFGKFLDPIVDKILILAVWVAFVELGLVTSVVPLLILLREFVVTGMRMMAAQRGEVLSAGFFGKLKMVVQIVVTCIFYNQLLPLLPLPEVVYPFSLIVMLGITVASGIDYLIKGKQYFL